MAKLNHYDRTGRKIIKVTEHETRAAQLAALHRAKKNNEIVGWAEYPLWRQTITLIPKSS